METERKNVNLAQLAQNIVRYIGKELALNKTIGSLPSCAGHCINSELQRAVNCRIAIARVVHGTYEAVKHVSGYTFYNEVNADDGSL